MSEHSNYCDYPTNDCMFASEIKAIRDKLQEMIQENKELKSRIEEIKNFHPSYPPVDVI